MSLTDTERAHIQEALRHQRNTLATTRITGEPGEIGRGLVHLAELHGMLDEHAESRRHYEEALGYFQTAGDKHGQAQVLFGLGVVRAHFEDHRGAIEHIAKATLLFNELKDQENEALCRAAIGESLRSLGQATAKVHCVSDAGSDQTLVDFQTEAAIAGAIGDEEDAFAEELATFGAEYGELARDDHRRFVDAFRNGAIPGLPVG